MELTSVRTEEVSGRLRVTGTVVYDDRPGEIDEYWFEFPAELADSISDSGNPWLVCLAPVAATLGESLRLALPVDRALAVNVSEVMAIWKHWYPRLRVAPIVAPSETPLPTGRRKTAMFFSGGVDSFFTLLHNEPPQNGGLPADDLIMIHGFDILLESEDAFTRHRRRLERVASETGKMLVPVSMNLRRTRLRDLPMAALWHGCALASVALLLEKRYERVLIAASNDIPNLGPWGSHPLTDPLLSTSSTAVVHDGAAFSRRDKLSFLTGFDVALRSLRVCSQDTSENCGACEKCYRNMIILDLLGALGRSATFPEKTLDLEKVSRIFVRGWRLSFYRDLQAFAVSRVRKDVASAIGRSLRRSRWRRPVVRIAQRVGRLRYVGRVGRWLKEWALAGYLR